MPSKPSILGRAGSVFLALVLAFPALAFADEPPPQPCQPPREEGSSVVILDYHTFLNSHESNIDFSVEEFAAQMDSIRDLGCNFITMEDFVSGRYKGRNNVLVTIDDGNHSVYRACREVLDPRGIKPVLFVYPAIILGKVSFAIKEEQLIELAAEGYTVGAHGYHHNPLSDKELEKSPKDFEIEIRKSGPALERILGKAPRFFAYPFGVHSATAEKELSEQGYELAFAAGDNVVPVNLSDPSLDRLAIPRTIVYRWNRSIVLRALAKFCQQ